MMFWGIRFFIKEPEPNNFRCLTGEEADDDDGHAMPEQQVHNKPNYQGEELVKMNLVTQKGESRPIL